MASILSWPQFVKYQRGIDLTGNLYFIYCEKITRLQELNWRLVIHP